MRLFLQYLTELNLKIFNKSFVNHILQQKKVFMASKAVKN